MHNARMFVVMAMLALGMLAAAGDALAQNATPPSPPTSTATNTAGCSEYVGLSNRIVMCLRDTIDRAAGIYFGEDSTGDGRPDGGFFRLISRAITGFFTLTVIIYGILAAYGMLEKPGRDVMLLMVKLSIVMGFVTQSDWLFDTSLSVMDASAAAVVQFTPDSGEVVDGFGAERLTCIKNMKEAANQRLQGRRGDSPNYSAAWLGMDCIIDTVIGIKVTPEAYGEDSINGKSATKGLQELTVNRQADSESPGMARGLINFFFSSMQSSVMGILLAVIGFVFIYSMVWMVLKGLFVYLAGYIGIAFMMIFAPLFIPLVLFRATSEYFKKWLRLTIAFALQPVIILAFVTFSVSAIDYAMFSGDYSVMYRIAGNASRAQGFNLNQYMDDNKLVLRQPTVVAGVKTGTETPRLNKNTANGAIEHVKGLFGKAQTSDCGKDLETLNLQTDPKEIERIRSSCGSYALQWWRNDIDWKAMALARKPPVVPAERVKDTTDAQGVITNRGDGADVTDDDLRGRAIAREVFSAVLFAAVVVLCINGLMTIVPAMVNDLVGDAFQSPNLFAEVSRQGGQTGGGGIASRLTGALTGGGGGR